MTKPVARTDRQAMTEARELAEQLTIVVGVQTPTQARSWLLDQVTSIQELANVALAAATMVEPDSAYAAAVAERFDPPAAKR
jgi:hypothetical protein